MQRRFLVHCAKVILVVVIATISLFSSACAPEKPQISPDVLYKNEVVNLVCPYGAGGGADLDARIFAARWGEITGGTMVNINKPAAGGIEGANLIYTSKPDGLNLGHGGPSSCMYIPTLTNDPALKVDVTKVNWFGALYPEQYVFAVGKHISANTIEELQQLKGLRFGAMGLGTTHAQAASIAANIFKLDMKLVTGYGSPSEVVIAIGKKEVDGITLGAQAFRTEEKKGFLKTPFSILDFKKSAYYPNVKSAAELTKLTPEQEELLNLYNVSGTAGKAFFGPPGIPADRVKFLRDAFDKTMANKAFVKQMQELRYPVWEQPLTGAEVEAQAAKVLELKKSYATLTELTKKYAK
jgi:tripartite-type tricarboxylate transporter receptor subunit TctC